MRVRIVTIMKLPATLVTFALLFAFVVQQSPAQNSYGATAYAERQQQEERWNRLSAQVQELLESQDAMRRRIQALEEENRSLRKDISEARNSSLSGAQLDKIANDLNKRIMEVDKKRVDDLKSVESQINNNMAEVKKILRDIGAQIKETPAGPAPISATGEYFPYTIQSGQTISAIVKAYRDQGINVTQESIMRANPGLDPRRLQVGQEIKIPKP